jgi:hypothetical protein
VVNCVCRYGEGHGLGVEMHGYWREATGGLVDRGVKGQKRADLWLRVCLFYFRFGAIRTVVGGWFGWNGEIGKAWPIWLWSVVVLVRWRCRLWQGMD